jgi:hypothetical protein
MLKPVNLAATPTSVREAGCIAPDLPGFGKEKPVNHVFSAAFCCTHATK